MSKKEKYETLAQDLITRLNAAEKQASAVAEEDASLEGTTPAQATPEAGALRQVAPHLLQDNPLNARFLYPEGSLQRLSEDLKLRGQLTPVRAFLRENRYVLVDGHRRVKAARLAGLEHIRVEVVKAPEKETDLYFDSLAANLHREPPTPLDDAATWGELLKTEDFKTQEQLAAALTKHVGRKVSQETISKTLALSELDEGVRDACVSAELITLRYLGAILQYQKKRGASEALDLVFETVKKGLSARDIESRVRSASGPAAKKPHALKHRVAFQGVQGELREFDQDGRVELRIRGLPEAERVLLVQQLKTLLAPPAPTQSRTDSAKNAPRARSLSPVS